MHGDDYHHGTTGLGGVVGGSDERGAAERAGGVRAQPLADAGGVEVVHARGQHPDGLALLQVRQAHPARALPPPSGGSSAVRTGGAISTSAPATVDAGALLSTQPPPASLLSSVSPPTPAIFCSSASGRQS